MLRRTLAVLTLALPAAAQEGGIEIFAGESLFESGYRVSLSYLDRGSDDRRVVLGLDHGLSRNVTVSALVPWVDRGEDGLGDVALLGKYRYYHDAWAQGSLNAALIGGVEMPTGADDETAGGLLLPPGSQPGTGSWNPFLATSVTYEQGRARFDGTLFHKLNTEGGQDFERGDFTTLDLSAAYRFYHVKYPGPTVGARVGLQYRHEGRDALAGVTVSDSGADLLIGKAKLIWHPRPDIDASIGVEEALLEDYRGVQEDRDTRLVVNLGLRF